MIITFTTTKEDGTSKTWRMTPNDLQERYWSEDENLPDLEDEITDFKIEDIDFATFEDVVMTFVGAID